MAGITSAANPLLTPTTATKTSQFSYKLLRCRLHFPSVLKSYSLISSPRASIVNSSNVDGTGDRSSGNSGLSRQRVSVQAQTIDISTIFTENVNGNLKLTVNLDDLAVIGLHGMQKANSSLEDFCRSYFMFHRLDINLPQTLFTFLPILSFAESYIYQMDNLNESLTTWASNGEIGREMCGGKESLTAKQIELFKTDPFGPLASQLESHGLLTDRIKEQFKRGIEYWNLERYLCCALEEGKEISVDDVLRTMRMKSFDYRIMNLLLYQLTGEKVNDLHMEFLSYSEFLMETSDDMLDYEDDVIENNFNIYRMFVGIYGESAPAMLSKCILEAQEKYDALNKILDPDLSLYYQKRRNDVIVKEGGKICAEGHPFGMASIPPPIIDEDSYRLNRLKSV